MRVFARSLVILAAVAVCSSATAADFGAVKGQGAQALLEESDKLINHFKTQEWRFKMTVKPASGEGKTMTFKVWQKDRRLRLVRFEEPGEVKGLSMLSRGKSVMYVYSPQTDNVRRVAAHAQRQTLLGSNMTYSDMSSDDLSVAYVAAMGEDAGAHQWLDLTMKEDANAAWDKLRVRIDKKTLLVDMIEYFEDGKVARIQTRHGLTEMGGAPAFKKIEMKTVGSGLVTVMDMLEQTVGADLPDSMFKKKSLVRGR